MATIHINAAPGDFAKTVLMPGDPLRAKYIAENFFDRPRLVTDVRNMLGFTGTYHGQPVSVMAHGMGIPSASIYATELIKDYGVERVIRVGSCGAMLPQVRLRDLVIAMGASTDSSTNRMRFGGYDLAPLASFELLRTAVRVAEEKASSFHVGNVFTSDLFYPVEPEPFALLARHEMLAIEMETAGLYAVAASLGAERLAILTVTDHISSGATLSVQERQSALDEMIELALETAIARARHKAKAVA